MKTILIEREVVFAAAMMSILAAARQMQGLAPRHDFDNLLDLCLNTPVPQSGIDEARDLVARFPAKVAVMVRPEGGAN